MNGFIPPGFSRRVPNLYSNYYIEVGRFIDLTTQVGPAINTITPVRLGIGGTDSEGIITVNSQGELEVDKSGPVMIKQEFQLAKATAAGTEEAFFTAQASFNGGATWITLGTAKNRRIQNANVINVFFDIAPVFLNAGTLLRNIWAQSSVGGDPLSPTVGVADASLLYSEPSAALKALGMGVVPSASAVIYKLNGYNYG